MRRNTTGHRSIGLIFPFARIATGFMLLAATLNLPAARGAEKPPIADKTLVAWVAPANLAQRGGSVLTLEKAGGTFDGIVFGEIAPSRWMAGSNSFSRTQTAQDKSPVERCASENLVQIAIVYRGKEVTLYRNGAKYAEYAVANPERFGNDSLVLIGLRHVDANPDNRFFVGSIDDVRIYNLALSAHQIAALKPNTASAPEPVAWWDFEDGAAADRMKRHPTTSLFGDARIKGGRLRLEKPAPT